MAFVVWFNALGGGICDLDITKARKNPDYQWIFGRIVNNVILRLKLPLYLRTKCTVPKKKQPKTQTNKQKQNTEMTFDF